MPYAGLGLENPSTLQFAPPLASRPADTNSAPSAQDAFRLQGRVPHPALSDLLREEEDLKRRDTPSLPYISARDMYRGRDTQGSIHRVHHLRPVLTGAREKVPNTAWALVSKDFGLLMMSSRELWRSGSKELYTAFPAERSCPSTIQTRDSTVPTAVPTPTWACHGHNV